MELKLLGKTILKGRKISISDCDGIIQKTAYGVTDDWYGGMVKKFGKIKNSNFLMCLDRKDNVLNIAYNQETLSDEELKYLGLKIEPEQEPEPEPEIEPEQEPVKKTKKK